MLTTPSPTATVTTSADEWISSAPARSSQTRAPAVADNGIRARARTPTRSLGRRPQDRTDRLQDLGVPEWLGDVGGGAELEPLEDLDLLSFRAQHDDGNSAKIRISLDRTAHLVPVALRQHDVEQHHIRAQRPDQGQPLVAVGRRRGAVAGPLQQELQREQNVRLVLDEQHTRLRHPRDPRLIITNRSPRPGAQFRWA